MLELGLAYVVMFFIIIGACLIFAASWIVKSEARGGIFKNEMRKLKGKIESLEREKFMLMEQLEGSVPSLAVDFGAISAPAAPSKKASKKGASQDEKANAALLPQTLEQNEALQKENKRIKAELEEAKNSLEEIYKAFVENKA